MTTDMVFTDLICYTPTVPRYMLFEYTVSSPIHVWYNPALSPDPNPMTGNWCADYRATYSQGGVEFRCSYQKCQQLGVPVRYPHNRCVSVSCFPQRVPNRCHPPGMASRRPYQVCQSNIPTGWAGYMCQAASQVSIIRCANQVCKEANYWSLE